MKERAKTQTKTKPNAPQDPRQPLKGKKNRPQFQHMLEPVSKILGRGYGKEPPVCATIAEFYSTLDTCTYEFC